MATYRTVVNVPSIPGSNELLPQPWAVADIDYGIHHGYINITDRHKEDWLEIVGSGRYWTLTRRQDLPRRVAILEADVVALAASAASQLAVNAAHLEAHDAMLDVMRLQDTRLDGLQSSLTIAEENIANILLLLSGDQPPTTGNWWDTQRTAALATLINNWGSQAGAPTFTSKQTINGTVDNIIVQNVDGRGVQGANGTLTHASVLNCGRTTLPTHSPRDPSVHLGVQGSGTVFTMRDSQVFDGKIQGGGGGNQCTITLERVHFRDNADGASQGDGAAVAAEGIKTFDFSSLTCTDLIVEFGTAPGVWMDGSGWLNASILRGLYQDLGGPAIFFELGKGGTSTDATIINCAEGFLIDADDITITGAAVFGTPWPVRIRPGPRSGLVRGVQASVTQSYVEFTAASKYGMARTWANNGPRSFTSDFNTFKLDPSWTVFRWGDLNGGPVQSYNFAGWQALGFDLNSVLV